MTYDQIDLIADSYIPILVALSAIHLYQHRSNSHLVKGRVTALVQSTLFIYALMLVDAWLGLWPAFQLDYSTHSALALVFIISLAQISRRALWIASSSFITYCALMLYQQYHSLLDMVTTTLVVAPVIIWLHYRQSLNSQKN